MSYIKRRKIFGDESALEDESLHNCEIELPYKIKSKSILRGRWGVGKTATFLIRHRALSEKLKSIDPDYQHIWYLSETEESFETIDFLQKHYDQNVGAFVRSLQEIWLVEIIRVHARILTILYDDYGKPNGTHWTDLKRMSQADTFGRSIWENLSNTLKNSNSDAVRLIHSTLDSVRQISAVQFRKTVNACLRDIVDHPFFPVVVIEPIESPYSTIELSGPRVSQAVLVSLLDLYVQRLSFSPNKNQYLNVEISIPWHRNIKQPMGDPQKLSQNTAELDWPKDRLRRFINKRIANEFAIVGRDEFDKFNTDHWNSLFGPTEHNQRCNCKEDSFSYFVRHTRHRARDLMRLARCVVEKEQEIKLKITPGLDVDDVLRGAYGETISEEAIISGVKVAVQDAAEDRIYEAERRFRFIREVISAIEGLEIPFHEDTLLE